jgi:hypothetical protein
MDEEEHRIVESAFIAALRAGTDRLGLLRLAGVPLEIERDGAPGLKLLEVKLCDHYVVGSATPGFGTRDLVYQPLPGPLQQQRTRLRLVYVSSNERQELTLGEALAAGGRPEMADHHRRARA